MVDPEKAQINKWAIHISYWINMAKIKHSEYVIITFPKQQWLHERAEILHYMFLIPSLVVLR
jgi:hypothetical protein